MRGMTTDTEMPLCGRFLYRMGPGAASVLSLVRVPICLVIPGVPFVPPFPSRRLRLAAGWIAAFRGALGVAGLAGLEAKAADGLYRFRLTETSVTESGRIVGAPGIDLKTRGYGLTFIAPVGVGLSYTFLTTRGQDELAVLHHDYLDLSYTTKVLGSEALVSLGTGLAVGGDAEIRGETAERPKGASYFVGPGYTFGWFEVYWICRLNFLKYEFDDGDRAASLRHCQLGLGANW
jgi:hypothetical protein